MRASRSRLLLVLIGIEVVLFYYLRYDEFQEAIHRVDSPIVVSWSELHSSNLVPQIDPVPEQTATMIDQADLQDPVEQEELEPDNSTKWLGESLEVPFKRLDLDQDVAHTKIGNHFPSGHRPGQKYFFYQPSGGWGNQRLILRWAMLVANAMNRTLAVAPIAAHSDIWHRYNLWQKDEVVPADKILDVRALNEACNRGVVFLDDVPLRVVEQVRNQTSLSVKVHVKGHYVNTATRKKLLIYKESEIRETWSLIDQDIVFWDKMSMWMCCVTDFSPDQVWYGRHIMFNDDFKLMARRLMNSLSPYNAVHVRRGDMTISKDRRTSEVYFKAHKLSRFDMTLPLYVATNEKDKTWFSSLTLKGRFQRLVFWDEIDLQQVDAMLQGFPKVFQADVVGFLESLICGNAVRWEGSKKSTFSAAISAIRVASPLREVDWAFQPKPSVRKAIRTTTQGPDEEFLVALLKEPADT